MNDTVRTETARRLGALRRQFPELLAELAPGGRSPAVPGPPPGPSGGARSTAPLRLHISDAIRDITDGVTELEEAVHDRLDLPRPQRARAPRRIGRLLSLLDRIGRDAVLAEHVLDEARRMSRRCSRALGGSEAMTAVDGRCPWCASVSLRAFPERRAVLCINPGCRCEDPGCGCRTDPAHRHSWPQRELPDGLPHDPLGSGA
ncbi:hypothetical protein IQ279_04475 [Streptomyces verrucosisporus]|uniref:hypothetical protein n=1 Tax=Streptomyces verrucosisporus TaxID=1695161 RepID=UPI0019CFC2C2|nr:hypothetical protein [Streptomyces verrucosisporus]MBN3928904.1 hypothetical protein [Streptomyces verrucosisporus]